MRTPRRIIFDLRKIRRRMVPTDRIPKIKVDDKYIETRKITVPPSDLTTKRHDEDNTRFKEYLSKINAKYNKKQINKKFFSKNKLYSLLTPTHNGPLPLAVGASSFSHGLAESISMREVLGMTERSTVVSPILSLADQQSRLGNVSADWR